MNLQEPFEEFDRWIDGIWLEANVLLTQALEDARLTKVGSVYERESAQRRLAQAENGFVSSK